MLHMHVLHMPYATATGTGAGSAHVTIGFDSAAALPAVTAAFAAALPAFASFSVVTFVCYWKYGQKYLNEAILYHVSRKDPRHNFAPNFFSVYLDTAIEDAESDFGAYILSRSLTKAYALASKITQYGLTVLIGIAFAYDLPFAMFAQTFAFVAFNSVITSQYFAWWCALLPISLATFDYSNRDSAARVMSATITWIAVSYTHLTLPTKA